MATFDQLSPEGRAIVELVLQRGKSYDELSDMLGMPEERVRGLARDALVELAPVSVQGVEEDWRGQLADYVLGQQSGPEATATKGHLRRSEAARGWTRSLLDSLEQLYSNGSMPSIPDGERGARRAATPRAAGPGRALTPSSDQARRRRLIAAAGAAALLVAFLVLIFPGGVLTGGDDDADSAGEQASGGQGQNDAQNAGQGARGQQSGPPAGIAIVVEQDGKRQLLVQAVRLNPTGQREAYEVWLYNSRGDSKSLGGQVPDEQGNYQALGDLPADFADYRFIDVSREPIDRKPAHAGDSVLRGRVPRLRQADAQGNQPATLGQTVLEPPS